MPWWTSRLSTSDGPITQENLDALENIAVKEVNSKETVEEA
jgi:hypothetical protein